MYCYCGALLKDTRDWQGHLIDRRCPKHGDKWEKAPEKKQKIGKYSGYSKTYDGFQNTRRRDEQS